MIWWLLPAMVLLALAAAFGTLSFGKRGHRAMGPRQLALPIGDPETPLDHLIADTAATHPGQTGLRIISDDLAAFEVRHDLARKAGRSLDVQYYYWKNDLTGKLLAHSLIDAADRKVRVRLLLDDINSMGLDPTYLALNSHEYIEVRLFNPSRSRESPWRRGLELIFRYFSATRRMHNKCWIADGRLAVVGGRNIGDAYFGAASGANFRDLDVLIAGRAVDDATAIFDSYWNSEAALPITALHKIRRGKLAKLRYRLAQHSASPQAAAFLSHVRQRAEHAPATAEGLTWIDTATVAADPPEKARDKGKGDWLSGRILKLMASAEAELFLVSPYFIPGREGMDLLKREAEEGVKLRILTNSLAATDVMIVHSAYAKYRQGLLAAGIKLYEQKANAGRRRISLFGSRTASLHTKAMVADGKSGFVGSFNLDPRSRSINTEMGVFFESEALGRDLATCLEAQLAESYEVTGRSGRLTWREARATGGELLHSEPKASRFRRALCWLAGLLPIESQL